mmetsp:Transcript_35916/g.86460  ORF Transcript_35916/g.86460 Transcript_35916/m.86460 type:complete len:445 (-) Transcript_35916:65-1399(-)
MASVAVMQAITEGLTHLQHPAFMAAVTVAPTMLTTVLPEAGIPDGDMEFQEPSEVSARLNALTKTGIPTSWQGLTAYFLLFLLKFCMAASVNVKQLLQRFDRKQGIYIGLFCQFLLLPLIGLSIVLLFRLHYVIAISLIVVTSCPGGTASNWLVAVFNADLPLSIAMTGVSTVVGIIMLPLNVAILVHVVFGQDVVTISMWKAMLASICIVVLALAMGLLVSKNLNSAKWRNRFQLTGGAVGIVLFIFMIYVSSLQDPLWGKPLLFFVAVSLPCILGLICSHLVSQSFSAVDEDAVSPQETTTITIEAVYQNVGMAASVLMSMFHGRAQGTVAGVCVTYGCVQFICLTSYAIFAWKAGWTYAKPDDPLLVVLTHNYQEDKKAKKAALERSKSIAFDGEVSPLVLDSRAAASQQEQARSLEEARREDPTCCVPGKKKDNTRDRRR